MDIGIIAEQIDMLEKEVKRHTSTYMLDADCSSIIDAQLNGHIKAILSYCKLNNLIAFYNAINDFQEIDKNAVEFFCLWDGLKGDILEHSASLQGKERQRIISMIASKLQATMKHSGIDAYLGGFSVPISEANYTVNSNRVYVENTLSSIDGITILNIAKDLCLISADIIETEIDDKLCSAFVSQQISKCKNKMNALDFDGAITNARTLVEEILLCIEEKKWQTATL